MGVGQIISEAELLQLQSESKERHMNRFENGKTKKRPYKRRKAYKKRSPKMFLPDLMAEMLAAAPKIAPADDPEPYQEAIIENTVQEATPEVSPEFRQFYAPKKKKEILRMSHPIQKPCHVPNPVGRNITRTPMLPDYSKKQSFVRPPAVYDNHKPSSYGIYAEMQKGMAKKSG